MPTELAYRDDGDRTLETVNSDHPLPIRSVDALQIGRTLDSGYRLVPGIVTGAAYQDGDAFGTTITFPGMVRTEVGSGQLYSATYLDLDDEGLQLDLHLFRAPPTYTPTDNAAYSPTDNDMLNYIGTVTFASFSNFGANQVSVGTFSPIAFTSDTDANLYGQCVTRGAPTIADGNLPRIRLVVLAD